MAKWNMESLERETRYRSLFDELDREDIYQASERLAGEIRERGFQNIIFVDASARPISTGLTTYWHKAFPGEPLPGIFFINADGFHPADETSRELEEVNKLIEAVLGTRIHRDVGEISQASIDRLQEVHQRLMSRKHEPTLIVDTCMHTGTTVKRITEALQRTGFADVEVASVSPDPDADAQPNFTLLDHVANKPCYPFGPEGLIVKGDDVVSERTEDPYGREYGNRIRQDIRDIIEEQFVPPAGA